MGTVYVTQQPKPNRLGWTPNLSGAAEFGKLAYVFSGSDTPYCDPERAMDEARHALHSFDPDEDYVLWPNSGDPASIWVVLMTLSRFPINKIRFLYWERKMTGGVRSRTDGFYSPVSIPFN